MKRTFKPQKRYATLTKANLEYFKSIKPATYHKVVTKKLLPIPNTNDFIEKETIYYGRLNVNYYNTMYGKGKTPNPNRTNNNVCVVPNLIYYNPNTDNYLLAIIGMNNIHIRAKATYRNKKGKEVSKKTLIKKGVIKENNKPYTDTGYKTLSLETIISIK